MVLKRIQINIGVTERFFEIISANAQVKNVESLGNGSTIITVEIASDSATNSLRNALQAAMIEIL